MQPDAASDSHAARPPASLTWTVRKTTGAMPAPFEFAVTVPLKGGQALIVSLRGAATYDPKTDAWTSSVSRKRREAW